MCFLSVEICDARCGVDWEIGGRRQRRAHHENRSRVRAQFSTPGKRLVQIMILLIWWSPFADIRSFELKKGTVASLGKQQG